MLLIGLNWTWKLHFWTTPRRQKNQILTEPDRLQYRTVCGGWQHWQCHTAIAAARHCHWTRRRERQGSGRVVRMYALVTRTRFPDATSLDNGPVRNSPRRAATISPSISPPAPARNNAVWNCNRSAFSAAAATVLLLTVDSSTSSTDADLVTVPDDVVSVHAAPGLHNDTQVTRVYTLLQM